MDFKELNIINLLWKIYTLFCLGKEVHLRESAKL